MRIPWTENGDINVADLAHEISEASPTERATAEYLRKVLFEVWADAYTHGWSDGTADRIPDVRFNPYRRENDK